MEVGREPLRKFWDKSRFLRCLMFPSSSEIEPKRWLSERIKLVTLNMSSQVTPVHEHGVSSLKFQEAKKDNGSLRMEYLKESKEIPSVLRAEEGGRRRRRRRKQQWRFLLE